MRTCCCVFKCAFVNGFVSISTRSCVLEYLRSSVHTCERLYMLALVHTGERGWVYKKISVSVHVCIRAYM